MRVFVIAPASLAQAGRHLADLMGFTLWDPSAGARAAAQALWHQADALVFVGALPIAVRAVSGLLEHKAMDPAVLCVTEDLSSVLVVSGGHLGGGSDLAIRISEVTGAKWIPTTATDRRHVLAPDRWAKRHGLRLRNKHNLAPLISTLLREGLLSWWVDPLLPPPPLPKGAAVVDDPSKAQVFYTPRDLGPVMSDGIVMVPRCVCAGVGFRRQTRGEEISKGVLEALKTHPSGPFLPESLKALGTWDGKRASKSPEEAANSLGCQVHFFSREEILTAQPEGALSPSAAQRHLSLPGVAEPCATLMGRGLGMRKVINGITVALSLADPSFQGRLSVVGIGPGDHGQMTMAALEELERCDVIVGYSLYVQLVPGHIREVKRLEPYGMGEEEARVIRSVDLASRGYRVALVCGGDPVLFGLAALASRHAQGKVSFQIIPGISAAQGAVRMVGPYYTNGLCMVSLSDYLQDWDNVVSAMRGAHSSGLSVALYNPVVRDRDAKLAEVRRIFRDRERALICKDISRPGETMEEVPVGELEPHRVDMRSLIIFPGSNCRTSGGLWRDLRGYRSEKSPSEAPPEGGASIPPVDALVLGGTKEGWEAARRLISLGFRVAVSVAMETGLNVVPQGAVPLVGRRDAEGWIETMRSLMGSLKLLLDCAHPFAQEARRNFRRAAEDLQLPLIRISRPVGVPQGALGVTSYAQMAQEMLNLTSCGDLVFLSFGVRGLSEVVPTLKGCGRLIMARVLPTKESLDGAAAAGLSPKEIICSWGPMGYHSELGLIKDTGARALGAKASGSSSGVEDKLRVCREMGIPLILLSPPEDQGVTMDEGIRRSIGILRGNPS